MEQRGCADRYGVQFCRRLSAVDRNIFQNLQEVQDREKCVK